MSFDDDDVVDRDARLVDDELELRARLFIMPEVLPLSFCCGLPEVEIAIGERRVRLMIDSGAEAAIALGARLLSLPGVAVATGEPVRFGDATGQRFEGRRFSVDHVRLGQLSFSDVNGVEHVFSEDFAPPNRNGFLGRSLLRPYRLLFDYARAALTLFSGPKHPDEIALEALPSTILEPGGGDWTILGELDGVAARFLIDTGSTHSLERVSGAPLRGASSRRRTLESGDIVLENLEFIEVDLQGPPADAILGASFFENRRVLVDVGGQRLRVG
jgi:hypothetical protein